MGADAVDAVDRHHLQAALGLHQLRKVDRFWERRRQALQAENLGVGVHFRALHLTRFYGCSASQPGCARWRRRVLSLPFFPSISASDIEDIAAAIRRIVACARRRGRAS